MLPVEFLHFDFFVRCPSLSEKKPLGWSEGPAAKKTHRPPGIPPIESEWARQPPVACEPASVTGNVLNHLTSALMQPTSLVLRVLAILPFVKLARHALHSPDLLPRPLGVFRKMGISL